VSGDALSSLISGAGESVSGALPSATDALFGTLSEGAADAATNVISDLGGSVFDAAGDVASSAGESVVDLVTDGIGSLLGALFD
jgi:hypothetical protein